jgi:membrane protein insertase Oxa1/YidC/SpoIIIJ
LYSGLIKVIKDPDQIVQFAYAPLQHLPWMQHLASNIASFDNSLFGIIDLSKSALSPQGMYLPALLLVFMSAGIQFLTSRQLMPNDKDGAQASPHFESGRRGAAGGPVRGDSRRWPQYAVFNVPIMVLLFTVNLAAALSLYWFTGGVVAYLQQRASPRKTMPTNWLKPPNQT